MRVFYAAGPGDIINAHKYWEKGKEDQGQMALTYSGQFATFCQSVGARAYLVGHGEMPEIYEKGAFKIEQIPKPRYGDGGGAYHLAEMIYGVRLFWAALKFRADVAVIHSGSTHYFVLFLFRLAKMKVIPVLHNTLWPAGFPQATFVRKTIRKLDSYFFRWGAHATVGVSPECLRQVAEISGVKSSDRLVDTRGQFSREYFAAIARPPPHGRPFRIVFAGRAHENKGIFDILEMARIIEKENPGLVVWDLCGSGPDLEELRSRCSSFGLNNTVHIHGHVPPPTMREIIARSHASIVPTKRTFEEGMALSAIEPALANRPVITCSVVPALEILGSAGLEAKTDDVQSYVDRILELTKSPTLYAEMSNACDGIKEQFFDRKKGFAASLQKAIFSK